MRSWVVALLPLLSACPEPRPGARDPDGVLSLAFAATPAEDARVTYDTIEIAVDGASFDADGPDGPEAVALVSDLLISPLDAPAPALTLHLSMGRHERGTLRLDLATDSGPAVSAVGRVREDDDDDDDLVEFRLEVDRLDLVFDVGEVHIGDAPWEAVVDLHPLAWLVGLPIDADDDGDGVVTIDARSGALYDQLIMNLRAAISLTKPPEAS